MSSQIFIVEDVAFVREAFAELINLEPDLSVVGGVATAEEALASLEDSDPDLVLVDISLPKMNGIELIRHLHTRSPELKTLVVTGHHENHYVRAALDAGANGFMMKGDAEGIIHGIRQVLEGNEYLCDEVRRQLGR